MTSLLAASLLCLALAVAPLAARAAELQVLAGGGIAAPLNELAKQFEGATGHKLTIRYGTTPELIKMATSGDPFDMVVVPRRSGSKSPRTKRITPANIAKAAMSAKR